MPSLSSLSSRSAPPYSGSLGPQSLFPWRFGRRGEPFAGLRVFVISGGGDARGVEIKVTGIVTHGPSRSSSNRRPKPAAEGSEAPAKSSRTVPEVRVPSPSKQHAAQRFAAELRAADGRAAVVVPERKAGGLLLFFEPGAQRSERAIGRALRRRRITTSSSLGHGQTDRAGEV